MSLQWFCFCFMDDIDPALIAETRVSRLGTFEEDVPSRKLQKKPEKKIRKEIKLKMFA